MKFGTKLIHNKHTIDKVTGALGVPIYQTSTFHQEDVDANQTYQYSRSENPTRRALEETIALLENGFRGFAFSSGMAATSSVLGIFEAGDHLIICEDVYGGTFRITSQFFTKFNVEVTFVDATDLEAIRSTIRPNTKGLYLETPSNPTLKITDLDGACAIAKEHQLIVMVDNTFMSPYLLRPIEHGADIVIHSATKFIGGHSDVVGGLVVVANHELAKRVYFVQNGFGAILGPQDCFLLLRGLKTLKVRMDASQKSAMLLAEFLETHPKIKKVYYPGLESHAGYEIHQAQTGGPGAVLSFETFDEETAKNCLNRIQHAAVAVSLGGVETIVSYPVKMSHAAMPKDERDARGITPCLIRVSVGLEELEDLLADFTQALQ